MDGIGELGGCRILVIGINYAPEDAGIGPYTTQACDALAVAGAEILVFAGVPHYPHWTLSTDYRGRLRTDELHGQAEVRRLRHTVPSRQSARTRSLYEITFGVQVLRQRLPWTPDLILSVTPSLCGSAAAALVAQRTRAPLVLWVQDLMGAAAAQSGIAGGARLARATSHLELWAARRATKVIVVSEAFQRYLNRVGISTGRIEHLPNWAHVAPPREARALARSVLGWREDEVIALHSGNMGLKQGLENLVEAARRASHHQDKIRFVLMGDGNQRKSLEASGAGVDTLQFLPPADKARFPDVLAAADVLLVNERGSAVDMSLPSKLTSYFSAGLPVIAAVPLGGGTAAEVQRSGGGWLVQPDDPDAVLGAVRVLGADAIARANLGRAGATYARERLGKKLALSRLITILAAAIRSDCLERTG